MQADAWVDRLDVKLRVLATQPMLGGAREQLAPGLRSLPFGPYVIFYVPLPDGIDVVRVLHSARDIARCSEKTRPNPDVRRSDISSTSAIAKS